MDRTLLTNLFISAAPFCGNRSSRNIVQLRFLFLSLQTIMPPTNSADFSSTHYSISQNFDLVLRPVSTSPTLIASQLELGKGSRSDASLWPLANDWNLRGRLGLGNWKCGRSTGPETTCPKPILLKNRDKTDSIISSMAFLSQESSELMSKLEVLAQIAHCVSHQRKDPYDNRKSKWMSIFPAQKKDILYLEVQTMEVFEPAVAKCPAIKAGRVSCGKKIGGRKVQAYRKKIGEIIQLGTDSWDSCIDNYLRILEKNIYCQDHELTMPLKRRNSWKSKISEILGKVDSYSKRFCQSHWLDESERQTPAFGTASRRGTSYQKISTLGALPSVDVDKHTSLSWLGEFDTTPFRILPRKNALGKKTLNDYIRARLGLEAEPNGARSSPITLGLACVPNLGEMMESHTTTSGHSHGPVGIEASQYQVSEINHACRRSLTQEFVCFFCKRGHIDLNQ